MACYTLSIKQYTYQALLSQFHFINNESTTINSTIAIDIITKFINPWQMRGGLQYLVCVCVCLHICMFRRFRTIKRPKMDIIRISTLWERRFDFKLSFQSYDYFPFIQHLKSGRMISAQLSYTLYICSFLHHFMRRIHTRVSFEGARRFRILTSK